MEIFQKFCYIPNLSSKFFLVFKSKYKIYSFYNLGMPDNSIIKNIEKPRHMLISESKFILVYSFQDHPNQKIEVILRGLCLNRTN